MKIALLSLIASALLLPWLACAQETAPPTPAVSPATSGTFSSEVSLETPMPAATPEPTPTPAPTVAADETPMPKGSIRLNFQNASLNDVLNYLSDAAGFVIVQEAQVSGTVNVVSRQSINADEAVDLLNSVLAEKGYVAIRNGRILKIVNRRDAQKRDLPVVSGSDPARIPRNDEMVTQILPVRYVEAAKLVDNIRPLLAADASMSANESSNAIIMTDTQTNIRRIAEIINALDTSVASVSSIRVFPLRFADAKQLSDVLTQLFSTSQNTGQQGNQGRGGGGFPGFGGFGRGGGGGGNAPAQTTTRSAGAKVVVVADQQSNSVIVSAPDDVMPTIAEIITRTDTNISDITETRIFQLQHADAMEMANVITSLYSDTGTTSQANGGNRGNQGQAQGQGQGNRGGQQNQQRPAQQATSERALLQARVVAVADARTNSVVVTSARETMMQIAETVGRLDSTDAKKQHVYIHSLENADADNVATILRGMFGDQSVTSTSAGSSTSRLNQRTNTGASSDSTDIMNLNSSRANGSRR